MRLTKIALVPLDDFYQTVIPESEWPHKTVEQRLNGVFDWSRVRSEALEPLRAGRPGRWHAFDFMRGLGKEETYSLKKEVTEVTPAPTILIEGAYSALYGGFWYREGFLTVRSRKSINITWRNGE